MVTRYFKVSVISSEKNLHLKEMPVILGELHNPEAESGDIVHESTISTALEKMGLYERLRGGFVT